LFAFVNFFVYPDALLEKAIYTFAALGIIYLIYEILLEESVLKKIKVSTTRYSLKKTLSILSLASYAVALLIIWIAETQYILLSLGLIGAAIAFALQDIFKNFAGGIMIFLNGIYHVGDRIEFNQKFGDVIDVGMLYTTLLETREWVSGDQVTGRLTIVPNGGVLTGTVQNYTRDFDFIWDELTIPITYDSDWREANTVILEIVKTETKEIVEKAEKIMGELEGKYYFQKRSIEPSIFLTLTDNWISFGIRYVTEVRSRRTLHDRLSRIILSELEKSDKIKIASATINITGFPAVRLRHEQNSS
jgi:small-conductance mechanosensitive channel